MVTLSMDNGQLFSISSDGMRNEDVFTFYIKDKEVLDNSYVVYYTSLHPTELYEDKDDAIAKAGKILSASSVDGYVRIAPENTIFPRKIHRSKDNG